MKISRIKKMVAVEKNMQFIMGNNAICGKYECFFGSSFMFMHMAYNLSVKAIWAGLLLWRVK